MTVVSNASPIINLAAIDRLPVLQQLYGAIIIPRAVYQEIAVIGVGEPGAREVQQCDWITTHNLVDPTLARTLSVELDSGEAGAHRLRHRSERQFVAHR